MNARMPDLLPALTLLIGGLALSAGLTLSHHPGEPALVVFAPSIPGAEAFARVAEAGWLPSHPPIPSSLSRVRTERASPAGQPTLTSS